MLVVALAEKALVFRRQGDVEGLLPRYLAEGAKWDLASFSLSETSSQFLQKVRPIAH